MHESSSIRMATLFFFFSCSLCVLRAYASSYTIHNHLKGRYYYSYFIVKETEVELAKVLIQFIHRTPSDRNHTAGLEATLSLRNCFFLR